MPNNGTDAISEWFRDAEELGEYIGIRFGHLASSNDEPEWTFLRHAEYDGIGGLAEILRRRGARLDRLLQLKHPKPPSWMPLLRSLPAYFRPRQRVQWGPLEHGITVDNGVSTPPVAVAWHVFAEVTTTQIRRVCRKGGVTVNSFLLKHLSKAIRPYLEDQSSVIPWMVPVNLRGKVVRDRDTANFSSYIGVKVKSFETVQDVHRNIYKALGQGEHWANWYAYQMGRLMTRKMRKTLITKERALSQWFLGGFSNLGEWDPERRIRQPSCQGAWLFSPPVLRCQTVGAGCITFQNRLSLTIQAHPNLTSNSLVTKAWMTNWVKEIEMDLVSVLDEPVAVPWVAA